MLNQKTTYFDTYFFLNHKKIRNFTIAPLFVVSKPENVSALRKIHKYFIICSWGIEIAHGNWANFVDNIEDNKPHKK